MLVVGGETATGVTDEAVIVDPVTWEVLPTSPLPWPADALEASTLHDGRVLVTGGRVAPGTGSPAAAIYDSADGTWVEVGPLATPRFKHVQATLADGRVLVAGGTPDDRRVLATTEVFDPGTGAFTPGPDLAEPRYKLSGGALALPDGRVLIGAGGGSVEVVDVAAGASTVLVELERPASFATVSPLEHAAVLVLGGYDDRIALTGLALEVEIPGLG